MKTKLYNTIRWAIISIILLMIITVVHETIQAANHKQFNQIINERVVNLEAMAAQHGKILLGASEKDRIQNYMTHLNGTAVFYNNQGKILFSTGDSPSPVKLPSVVPNYKRTGHNYVTVQRMTSDGNMIGYIKLTTPYPYVKGLPIFYGFLFIVGVVLVMIYDFTVRQYSRTLSRAAFMAEKLSEGSYEIRASETDDQMNTSKLTYSMNILARHLEQMSKSYLSQQGRLETLIENIGSGLIFIDGNGHISLINKTYRETFRTTMDNWENRNYQMVPMDDEIKTMITTVFHDGEGLTKQIKLPVHIERKHFDVSCVPIREKNRRIRGVVLVFHDITELKKLEKMRKDFVANVSHELKTPVTSVIGFTETLLDGAMEDEELTTKFLTIMLNESKRLQTLISELLELSKIEQDHFVLDFQPVDMKVILDETIMVVEDKAKDKDITLDNTAIAEVQALGDTGRIRQIMMNLITNAISYTPPSGTITTALTSDETTVTFSVSDTGIGIDKDQVPRIFERFYRVDKARSRNQGGTGLGLAIVKHLVEAHEGHINVLSEPGKGTTFEIIFKKA